MTVALFAQTLSPKAVAHRNREMLALRSVREARLTGVNGALRDLDHFLKDHQPTPAFVKVLSQMGVEISDLSQPSQNSLKLARMEMRQGRPKRLN